MAIKKISPVIATIGLTLILQTLPSLQSRAFAVGPLTFNDNDGQCPPSKERDEAAQKMDIVVEKVVNGERQKDVTAWMIKSWHRDDGKGNDLTVDQLCVKNGAYFSLRIPKARMVRTL